MSTEKLTVDKVILKILANNNDEEYIQNAMQKNREVFYNLLSQIRDELSYKFSYNGDIIDEVDEIFNEYLNEKGGK